MEPRGAPKTGRLFLKTHGDCFLHATASWLKYWNFTLEDRVAIVRVTHSNERSFLTTLSPVSIPYDMVRKGMPRDRYLEIDPRFGRKLGIMPDTEVAVDPVRDIEHCTSLHLVPENPSDYEKLEDHSDKIDFELMDKIRVVSAQSFSFPIWVIDNIVVLVKVVSCEPRAKWVLLVSGKTVVHIERDTEVADTGTESLPERSSTGGTEPSEECEDQAGLKLPITWDLVDKAHKLQTCPGSTAGGSSGYSSQAVTPDSADASVSSGFLASLLGFTRNIQIPYLTQTDNVGVEEQVKLPTSPPSPLALPAMPSKGRTRSEEIEGSDKRIIPDGVSIVEGKVKPQSHHRRYNTWHAESDFKGGHALKILPNYIGTPKLKVCLRVQPHSIHQVGKRTSTAPQRFWNHERVLDVFVHPSTIPEVFHYVQQSPSASILVELQPVELPHTPKPKTGPEQSPAPESKHGTVDEEDHPPDLLSDMREFGMIADMDPFWMLPRPSKPPGQSPKPPDQSPKPQDQSSSKPQDQSSNLQDQSSKPQDQSSKPPDQSPKPHERSKYFSDSVIVRLCFATKVKCGEDGMMTEISGEKTEDISVAETADTPVKVGHIMMSDVVRQQLKIEECSIVQLLNVKDEWRANPGSTKSMVRLYPLGRKEQIEVDILTAAFEDWVRQVYAVNELGAVIVNKQIIPMKIESGEWIKCKVAYRCGRPRDELARIPFCLVKPSDLKSKRVKLSVDQRSRGPTLTEMTKLNLPVTPKSREEFGGLEKLEEAGLQYLHSVFSEPHRSGALLICGLGGSSGSGCGKSSLANLLCKSVSKLPYCAHVSVLDCTSLRGQNSPQRLKKRITQMFARAIWCQPSVLLLEKLDHGMPHMGDAQEAAVNVDVINGVKRAQVFLDCMAEVKRVGAQVVVIATAQSKQQLQKDLLQARGKHVFEKVLEIAPPSLEDRKAILRAVMYSKGLTVLGEGDLRDIAFKTEGFQARDLVTLTDRAVTHSQLRPLQPIRFFSHPLRFRLSTDSLSPLPMHLPLSSLPNTPLASSPKKNPTFKPGTSPQKKLSIISNASTLVPFTEDRNQPRVEDFLKALKGFVPLSLQGLSLHSSGSVDFSDIGGLTQAKQTLEETLLWPSKYPRLFSQCTIKQRCGLLLYGAPGTGKTLLAGAVAKEFGLNFVSIKGPELLSKYIGASELAVRDIFTRAQSARPCILFFDEFDSLAPKRGHDRTGVTDRVVNQLLTQLDGVEALQGVYVLAASSRPDLIDPALLRPGRIDHSLFCDVPNKDARAEILEALSKNMPFDEEVDMEEIAEKTDGFTGADLKAVLYNAQLQAAHAALDSDAEYSHQSVQTSEEEDLKLKKRLSGGGRETSKLVFSFTSSGLRKECHSVEATRLEKLKERSVVWGEPFHSRKRAVITQAQLLNVLQDAMPSVSEQEKKKYGEIYERYAGKTKPSVTTITQQIATMA